MNLGLGLLAMSELNVAQMRHNTAIRNARITADNEISKLEADYKEQLLTAKRRHRMHVFAARSNIHGLNARIEALQTMMAVLLDTLKEENPNHALVDDTGMEAIARCCDDEQQKALFDPEIQKKTWKDGKIPRGAIAAMDQKVDLMYGSLIKDGEGKYGVYAIDAPDGLGRSVDW